MITAVGWIICAIFPPSSIKPRRILVSATATPKQVLLPIRSSGEFSVLHGGVPRGRDYAKDYVGEVKVESNCQIFFGAIRATSFAVGMHRMGVHPDSKKCFGLSTDENCGPGSVAAPNQSGKRGSNWNFW